MKKILYLTIILVFIANTVLFAFENDLYKVNDKGWKHKEERGLLIFTLDNSKEFVDPETEQTANSNLYILIRVLNFDEQTPDDYSSSNAEKFKKQFQDYLTRNVNNQKNSILKDLYQEFPGYSKEYLEKRVNQRFERTKINSHSVTTIGKFKSYFIDFYNENFNVKYYSLHTMNHRYQIQIYYYKELTEEEIKPAMDFVNSFEPKDIAPTKMNAFMYGSGLKITLAILLLLAFIVFKIFNSKRS